MLSNQANQKAQILVMEKAFNLPQIEVKSGHCRYNFHCHNNAVHEAVKAFDKEVAMVFAIRNLFPVIHFINVDRGIYTDNTLGVWSRVNQYHLIMKIPFENFFNIEEMFSCYRDNLRKEWPWWVRKFSNVEF